MGADHRPSKAVEDSGTANPLNGSDSNLLANSKLWHIVVVPRRELSLGFIFVFLKRSDCQVSPAIGQCIPLKAKQAQTSEKK
jgi:hypothetical protein